MSVETGGETRPLNPVEELERLIVRCRDVERGQTTLESLRNDIGCLALILIHLEAQDSFVTTRRLNMLKEKLR